LLDRSSGDLEAALAAGRRVSDWLADMLRGRKRPSVDEPIDDEWAWWT
jgi:hypothetical protein